MIEGIIVVFAMTIVNVLINIDSFHSKTILDKDPHEWSYEEYKQARQVFKHKPISRAKADELHKQWEIEQNWKDRGIKPPGYGITEAVPHNELKHKKQKINIPVFGEKYKFKLES